MQTTHLSMLPVATNTLSLPITSDQLAARQGSELVHVIFCHLLTWDYESILTGIKRAKWDALFPTGGWGDRS